MQGLVHGSLLGEWYHCLWRWTQPGINLFNPNIFNGPLFHIILNLCIYIFTSVVRTLTLISMEQYSFDHVTNNKQDENVMLSWNRPLSNLAS